jgi:hypothetical protein
MTQIFCRSGFLTLVLVFLLLNVLILLDFYPKMGDLEPFLRPDLGGKLGGEPQPKSYINQKVFDSPRRFINNKMMKSCEA